MSNDDGPSRTHNDQNQRSNTNSNERPVKSVCSQTQSPRGQGSPRSGALAVNPALNELRLVLLGKTGAGKSATGNTILGDDRFDAEVSMSSVTEECRRECATVEGRELVLVDTPMIADTDLTEEQVKEEAIHCLSLCSPGPHVFLLVIPIERYTEEQQRTVQLILEMFNEDITHHSILIFSHADRLGGQSIEEFISGQSKKVKDFVERFGRRFVAFDNKNPANREQVRRLLQKVDELLAVNGNRYYTNEVTQAMQTAQRIIEEKRKHDIKKKVRKMSDVRWRVFTASMNEERQETERKKKCIQGRIDQIQKDIENEKQNVQLIPARLRRFRASLQKELENMRKVKKREIEEETERKEREEKEKKNLKIWVQEEEQRRLSEEGQNNILPSYFNKKIIIRVVLFFLGVMIGLIIAYLFSPQQPDCNQCFW